MKKVVVSGLKLRLFEQKYKKVNDKEQLFAYLETMLKDARGRKYYSVDSSKVVHENPVDEVTCAEQIAIDIRQLDLGKAVNDGARKVLDECVKEWFESVKQRSHSPANESAQDEASTPKEQAKRQIKEAELKQYFQVCFYNVKNGCIDWFSHLVDDLCQERTGKDFAYIAYRIYEGGYMLPTKKPRSFTKWYRIFCDLVGCKMTTFKPNKLKYDLDGFSYLKNPRKPIP